MRLELAGRLTWSCDSTRAAALSPPKHTGRDALRAGLLQQMEQIAGSVALMPALNVRSAGPVLHC